MLALVVVFGAFVVSRLHGLTALPVFVDEAVQINWAFHIERTFRILATGKVLQVWCASWIVPWADDVLWATRALSVAVGALGLWATYDVGRRLCDAQAGLLASALYVLCPFLLFYDRIGLSDVFLASFTMLVLSASLLVLETGGLAACVVLGIALTMTVLAKVTGLTALFLPFIARAVLPGKRPVAWRRVAFGPVLAIVATAYPVRFFLKHTMELGAKSVLAAPEAILAVAGDNLLAIVTTLDRYWTRPVLVAVAVSIVLGLTRRSSRRPTLLLLGACGLPILAVVFGARFWYPRYLLPATAPALVLLAAVIRRASRALRLRAVRPWVSALAVALLSIQCLPFDLDLLSDPSRASLLPIDFSQYVTGWSSGYGTVDAATVLRDAARQSADGIRVVTQRGLTDRTPLRSLKVYLYRVPVAFTEANLRSQRGLELLPCDRRTTFALSAPLDDLPRLQNLGNRCGRVMSFRKPGGSVALALCRLRLDCY
jgi:hypothetical protein